MLAVALAMGACGKQRADAPAGDATARAVAPAVTSVPAVATAADEFVLIPAGSFQMGDATDERKNVSVHTVYVRAFQIAKHEVTRALWEEVMTWGSSHGYSDLPTGSGKQADHPVHSITWYEMVRWCNARSEMEHLAPCYTVNAAIYRTGSREPECDWDANGYRLPSEAEWEKAARGGLPGKRYPWGDSIGSTEANYHFEGNRWATGVLPQTSPVGSYPANGYGLFDMAGNVWEACWDWVADYPAGEAMTDPRGPATGTERVRRGGSWRRNSFFCRVGYREGGSPDSEFYGTGFRVARSGAP